MGDRHGRSIQSTAVTILGYIKEIRSLIAPDTRSHTPLKGRLTGAEGEEIDEVLARMENAIDDYLSDAGLTPEEADVKWRIYILSQLMEDMVHDMRPERLNRTHGCMEPERAEKLRVFCGSLHEQIRRLKALSADR